MVAFLDLKGCMDLAVSVFRLMRHVMSKARLTTEPHVLGAFNSVDGNEIG